MEMMMACLIGIGLSAACGYRIFVPFFVMSIAANTGHITLSPGFEWISSNTAVLTFAIAAILEIGAYYIPVLDNLLDGVAFPASFIAGTILMASVVSDISPMLKWALAVIAGGGMAISVQSLTTLARIASTTLTAGLGNPLFSTAEAASSVLLASISIFLPIVALIFVIFLIYFVYKKIIVSFYNRYFLKA